MMSTVSFKFSLLQAASTAEHVAPWVHIVRKWVTVYGVMPISTQLNSTLLRHTCSWTA